MERSDTVKAILVLNEMPENCFKCKLQDWANCRIVKGCHTGDTRPDWCPLRPAPEKRQTTNDFWQGCVNIVRNHCIDEILGNKE